MANVGFNSTSGNLGLWTMWHLYCSLMSPPSLCFPHLVALGLEAYQQDCWVPRVNPRGGSVMVWVGMLSQHRVRICFIPSASCIGLAPYTILINYYGLKCLFSSLTVQTLHIHTIQQKRDLFITKTVHTLKISSTVHNYLETCPLMVHYCGSLFWNKETILNRV